MMAEQRTNNVPASGSIRHETLSGFLRCAEILFTFYLKE